MGNSVRATGANWYLALNTRLGLASTPAVETAPVVPAPAAPTNFAVAGGAGTLSCSWTGPTSSELCEIWMDGPRSAGRQGSIARAIFHDRPAAELDQYVFLNPLAGTYTLYARTMSEADGQVSTWVSGTATVT
jgi:hypothetical protein